MGLLSYLSRGLRWDERSQSGRIWDGGGPVPDGQTGVKVADGTAPFEMMVSATSAATWEAKALNPSVIRARHPFLQPGLLVPLLHITQ